MAENQAEQQPQDKKGEKKPKQGTLESVVKELYHAGSSLVRLGLAAAIPYTQASMFPSLARDTAVLAGAQVAGDATTNYRRGKKTTSGDILRSSIIGTIIASAANKSFEYINKIPLDSLAGYVERGAAFGGLIAPAFIGMYQTVDYFVRNLSFRGMGKYLKENYLSTLKTFWKRIFPFSLANIFFVPTYLQIPVAAALQYMFTLFGAPKKDELKEEEKRDKTPYYVALANVTSRGLKNVFYGVPKAIYAVGNTLYGKLLIPRTQAAQPKAAPAQ